MTNVVVHVNSVGMAASHKHFGCFERVELAYIE